MATVRQRDRRWRGGRCVLWPRLNATLMRRCGGDPWRIARLVSRRTFKISMKEYEDIGIKVGDKVTIEITKFDNNIYT